MEIDHLKKRLLIYTPAELAEISERHFIRQALKEGKVLYESK